MKFSTVNTIQKSRDFYRGFAGYNNTYNTNENEFEDMLNMSMDDYPYIRTRKHRGYFSENCLISFANRRLPIPFVY